MLHGDITQKIIASAIKVHTTLGNGFQEVNYQRALKIEMSVNKLCFETEKVLPIYYKGKHIGIRKIDFFVEGKIMVVLKVVFSLEDAHLNQVLNYCEAYKMEIGLLINFGAKSLEFKRVHNNKILNSKK